MSAPMVRAILDGRKTQTRRVVKPQPDEWQWQEVLSGETKKFGGWCWDYGNGTSVEVGGEAMLGKCPYGMVGDRLWVRERFRAVRPFTGDMDHDYSNWNVSYYADDNPGYRDRDKWRPSIHMPRWASRITIEIESVRVERLRDIPWRDVRDEGVDISDLTSRGCNRDIDAGHRFADLWDTLHAKDGHAWETNPWVWRIQFRKV